ncbi:glycosyltransferase [Sphingomonas bacterium]|uniref:glycosyltransferase n=1 Tax=Sphingomonas bacterium TaxID=1895847 RepID=UPI001576C68B|nr:glycosyltransferase [Sphingomonas bacterium]
MPTVILAPTGTQGDINPFLAVALALQKAGCRPVMAVMDDYCAGIAAQGVEVRAIRPGRREIEADGHDDASIARAVSSDLRAGLGIALPHLAASYLDLSAAMRGADVVVGGSLSTAARIAAEVAGLPLVTLVLQPMGFLSAAEPPLMSEAPWLRSVGQRCGRSAVRALYALASWRGRASLRPAIELRRRLGLAPLRDELIDGPRRSERIVAMYPASFAPLAADAPPQAISAGFAFHDGPPGVPLDAELDRFLRAGPPPIVFTLGSFVVHAPGDFFPASAAAARRLGRRAVLLVGRHAVDRYRHLAGPDVAVAGHAPHSALLPRCAAVVHHGGIGTIAQALRAGILHLACPYFGDQFDNADRLVRLAVARSLALRDYASGPAAAALAALLGDRRIIARADALSGRMTAIDGPWVAAAEVARIALRQSLPPLRRVG